MSAGDALHFRFVPSPRFAGLIVALHAAAAVALWLLLPGAAGTLLGGLLMALGIATARDRALLRGPAAPRGLSIEADAGVLELGDGRRVPVRFGSRRYVARGWVALPMRGAGPRRTLVVSAGMLEPQAHRRLRLWALWSAAARAVAGEDPSVAAAQRGG